MTPDFPRVTKWLADSELDENHAAYAFKLSDRIAPAFEYFLGLEEVPGYEQKLAEVRTRCTGPPNRNEHLVHWAAFCAELGAIYLLGDQLGLPILGLDQPSPRAPTRNCDVKAEVEGQSKFFEVKRKASEDKQIPPPLLLDRISKLGLPYAYSIELRDRGYDCDDLDEQVARLGDHLDFFRNHEDRDLWLRGDTVPLEFATPGFVLRFHAGTPGDCLGESFVPMTTGDVRSWLLEAEHLDHDGAPMIPMVQKAAAQGADYLMCRVSPGGPWAELIEELFATASPINSRAFSVNDPELTGLQGIILFSKYDDFCIVNSATADHPLL